MNIPGASEKTKNYPWEARSIEPLSDVFFLTRRLFSRLFVCIEQILGPIRESLPTGWATLLLIRRGTIKRQMFV